MSVPRKMNWENAAFTPDVGGTAIPLIGVTNAGLNRNPKFITGAGDGDMGPTSFNLTDQDPEFSVDLEDIELVRSLGIGTTGMFAITQLDALHGIGTGAINYTLAHAYISDFTVTGKFRQFGSGTVKIKAIWPDGVTNPLSITIAA